MKRVIAIVLALAMLLSLTAVAFANGLTLSADKTEIKAGETLEVTYTVKDTTSTVLGIDTKLGFNADYFEYDREASIAATEEVAKSGATVTFNKDVVGTGADASVQVSLFFISNAKALNAGDTFAKLVVKAKQDITAEQMTEFKATVSSVKNKDGSDSAGEFAENTTLTVTVKPAVSIEGYTVAASGTASVKLNETAQVTLTIGNKDNEKYNAYDMTVTYNTTVLTYTDAEKVNGETPTVVDDGNGTLRVTGYGEDKTCGTDNIVLNFTAKATGSGNVTVTAAKVDEKSNAISSNAPDAAITTATATITVGGYTVGLTDDFTGESTTTGAEDYTFTPKDTDNYDYTDVTVTIGDKTYTLTQNADGSYTIPANLINGNITVTGTKTGKTRSVTITGEDTTGDANATYGEDYTFTVDKKDGYNYEVAVKVGDKDITAQVTESNGTYTIKGADLTGDVTITVTKTSAGVVKIKLTGNAWNLQFVNKMWTDTEVAPGTELRFTVMPMGNVNVANFTMKVNGTTYPVNMGLNTIPTSEVTGSEIEIYLNYAEPATTTTINFTGDGAADVKGGTSQTATNGQDFTFSLNEAAGYTYVVKLGDTVLTAVNGTYTIPSDQITGTDLTITITKTANPAAKYDVTVSEYVKLSGSKSVFLIKATATGVADGNVLTYDGNQMYWSAKYNAYAWLVISDQSLAEVQTAANGLMGNVPGTKDAIKYDGDVNQTDAIDINDAQLVWNMYNAQYGDFETVNVRKFLEADMNGDSELNTLDAAAVVAIVNHTASVSGS